MKRNKRYWRCFTSLLLIFLTFSCFEVEQVDNSKIEDELRLVKPMRISDGELMAVAQEIGDSLLLSISVEDNGISTSGLHEILVAQQDSDTLTKSKILKDQYEAFEYALQSGEEIPSNVKKRRRTDYVSYHTAKFTADSTLKLVAMKIKVKEINLRIAKKRAHEKLMRKLNK